MDTAQITTKLVSWIKETVTNAGCQGIVIGMSGGIDSSVGAVLCKKAFPDTTLGILIPCYSSPEDAEHARLVAEKFSIPTKTVMLDSIYDSHLAQLAGDIKVDEISRLARANLKVRLRMVTLYFFANQLNYMVVGSSNKSELSIGYFTKYGDSGVDMLPLANLVKKEVFDLAAFLGIPEEIINKPPSAGLWEGQTDEEEMGITYEELDHYLLTGKASDTTRVRIEAMMAGCTHKRQLPPTPDF